MEKCSSKTLTSESNWILLRLATASHLKLFIVVDAVDEVVSSTRRYQLLEALGRLTEVRPVAGHQKGIGFRVFISARPNIGVDFLLPSFNTMKFGASNEDVRRYLEAEIKTRLNPQRLLLNTPQIERDIVQGTMHKSI